MEESRAQALTSRRLMQSFADGGSSPRLSEVATNLLVFLLSIPKESACEGCTQAYLGLERLTALKAIRELILASRIFCSYRICALCRELRLCSTVRRLRAITSRLTVLDGRRGGGMAQSG